MSLTISSLASYPLQIDFKILLLVFKTLNGKGPGYLKELLVPYMPSRTLRSSSNNNLVVPRVNSVAGERAFSFSAPKHWNELPHQGQPEHQCI